MSKDREHERPDDVVGHKTLRDGTHLPLRRDEAEALRAAADAAQAAREALMPTERAAISILFDAWLRLKDMGWREAIYCPKDGSSFDVIEAGSTGIHRCHYEGKWPEGCWWIEDHGDLSPSHPMLFRLDPEAEAARKAKMEAARKRFAAEPETSDEDWECHIRRIGTQGNQPRPA